MDRRFLDPQRISKKKGYRRDLTVCLTQQSLGWRSRFGAGLLKDAWNWKLNRGTKTASSFAQAPLGVDKV